MNVPLPCPEAIVIPGGTSRLPLLLLSPTTVALPAALLSVTVHVLVALLPKAPGVHDNPVSCAGALAFNVNVCVPPFKLAVSCAV